MAETTLLLPSQAERLNAFPPSAQEKDKNDLSCHNIVLMGLDGAIRQENKIKVIQPGKEEVILSLFAGDMIVCIENSKNIQKKTPPNPLRTLLLSKFNKVT